MKKSLYIFLIFGVLCFSCGSNKKDEIKYQYLYGKWKYDLHDEVWIDENYIFFGCPDFPILLKYNIENDTIFGYINASNKIFRKIAVPKQLGLDTIIWGVNHEQKPMKYYRVRKNSPQIDTTISWEKRSLLEIVNYSYDKK